ncbi:hypothetical protein KCMC57_up27480 [Kitasatospora sp. CMC57]|uniref:Uncharacterized protein n=1 Tax=Kitasatospora sp. CMC57 TaxID=3231513 RepID=A0AB33JY52_9ACTN
MTGVDAGGAYRGIVDNQHAYAVYGQAGPFPEIAGRTAWHTAVSVGQNMALLAIVRTHPPDPDLVNRTYRPTRVRWHDEDLDRRSAGGGSNGRVSESLEIFAVPDGPLPDEIELTLHATDGTPHTVRLPRL